MSRDLQVSQHAIKGTVMKAIENLHFFHDEEYHKRFLSCDFRQPYCYFYANKKDTSFHKSHR